MNPKSKKYYQLVCQINKQNVGTRQSKNRLNPEKDTNTISRYLNHKSSHVVMSGKYRNLNNVSNQGNTQQMPRCESKRNVGTKGIREIDQNSQNIHFAVKQKVLKLPKITRDDSLRQFAVKKKHSKSYKKIMTENYDDENDILQLQLKTLSPKQTMKDVLLGIVKSKEHRHLASIDQQIDKLQALTKRYSCLRKDLVSIQQDILTISFKQKERCKERDRGRETSHSSSIVFM